ncbi:crossover junction endodeoxyribonuclease RuvC [Virgibacillus pantothenticus]|uniref:crossover junction endodeoxyribonuclease RuvC n=1 Tax=Virgibacillus pantothenticus TaxID=1473 RepID=UPI000985155A|nr:crossover junction endodeoxyribonuclease RuvC [Virgibacillus pantothenticus]
MTNNLPARILGLDLSLSRPGAAIIDIDKRGRAKVIAVSNVKTDADQTYALRGRMIEAWLRLFVAEHNTKRKPIALVVREKYAGKFGHASIFTAHSAADRVLSDFGLAGLETAKPIAQQRVKKLVVGKGRAEKDEVADAVRKWTGYDGEFASSDESDACAVALAWAIENELIEGDE